jgi:acyl carrier protein
MLEQLKNVFAELFDCAPGDIPDDADSTTLAGWDSLRHIELMLALESELGVRIPTESMLELTSLKSIAEYLDAHVLGGDR